jgi:hypothetical protein
MGLCNPLSPQTLTESVVRSSHMAHMYDKVIEKLQ